MLVLSIIFKRLLALLKELENSCFVMDIIQLQLSSKGTVTFGLKCLDARAYLMLVIALCNDPFRFSIPSNSIPIDFHHDSNQDVGSRSVKITLALGKATINSL